MTDDVGLHVEALVIWHYACGGLEFSKRDYLHLMACSACENLADEIGDALGDLEKMLLKRRRLKAAS